MFTRATALKVGLVAASLVVFATACGSSSKTSSPQGSASTGQGSSASGSPVKIGLAVAESGFNATQYQIAVTTAKAWEANINQSGGLGGHPVQIVIRDTAGTPATAIKVVNQLIDDDHVVALIYADSGTEPGVAKLVSSKNIAVTYAAGIDQTTWTGTKNFFASGTMPPVANEAFVDATAAGGATNLFAIVCAEAPACAQISDSYKQRVASSGNKVKFVGLAKAAATDPTYTAQCLAAIQQKADAIAIVLTTDVALRAEKDCLQQGYKGTFVVGGGTFDQPTLDKVPGAHYVGWVGYGFPWWVDAAPVNDFRSVMQKQSPTTDFRTPWATSMWSTLQLFKATVSSTTAPLTAESVLAAYGTVKNQTLDGLLPSKLTYTAGQPSPPVNCFWLVTYTAGDKNPKLVQGDTTGNNGASGDLASSCINN